MAMWFNGVKDFRVANTGKGGCVLHIVKSIDTSSYTTCDCEGKRRGNKVMWVKEGWREGGMEGRRKEGMEEGRDRGMEGRIEEESERGREGEE